MNADAVHYEFLAIPGKDPREDLIDKLSAQIPKGACILTYKMSFEKGVLEQLGKVFPKYKGRIKGMIKNIRDLMILFQRRHVYLWQARGSYSLKEVLPAFLPELSYDDLAIQNGGMASKGYFEMDQMEDAIEQEKLRSDLLEYCKLDTLAMVKIVEKLGALTGPVG